MRRRCNVIVLHRVFDAVAGDKARILPNSGFRNEVSLCYCEKFLRRRDITASVLESLIS